MPECSGIFLFYDEDGEDEEIYDLTDRHFKSASEIDFDKYVAVLTEHVLKKFSNNR